jgi:type VI protein secretion system component Hcp
MQLDGFLELLGPDDQPVGGETTDRSFKGKGIAIEDFSMGDSTSEDDEKKKVKGKGSQGQHKGSQGQQAGAVSSPSGAGVTDLLAQLTALLSQAARGLPSAGGAAPLLAAQVKADAQGHQAAQAKPEGRLCFSVSKDMDLASPALFQAYCRMKTWREPTAAKDKTLGQFSGATVTLRKFFGPMAFSFLIFKFTEVRIISYSLSVGDDAVPKEKLQFKFKTYTVEYTAQEPTGARGQTKTSNWDVGNNAPV